VADYKDVINRWNLVKKDPIAAIASQLNQLYGGLKTQHRLNIAKQLWMLV
jgi:hypothetical protein